MVAGTESISTKVLEKDFQIELFHPIDQDGAKMWELVKNSGTLDLNSAYSYFMMAKFFKQTCIVAKSQNELAGFVSAFILPDKQDTVFVWQIGVSEDFRGHGIGTKMLDFLLRSESCSGINYLEATISPSNKASQALFTGIAKKKNTTYEVYDCFPEEWFPNAHHEEELTYRIGPF